MTPKRPTGTVSARKTNGPSGAGEDFTYSVLKEVASARPPADRRGDQRRRTRLRSGKIIDDDGQFVIECLIVDRSFLGGKLRLPKISPLPARVMLYDDQSGELLQATVIWRRDRETGIRFTATERNERYRAIADAMRRKFYAMRR